MGEFHEVEGLAIGLVAPGAVEILAVEEQYGSHSFFSEMTLLS
jgi:hypothetical protein